MLTTISSLLVVLALLFGGTGATVYAAQDSLPTDLLYPVKTISEDLRLEMIDDAQAKIDLLTGFIQNRFMEYNLLAAAGEPAPEEWADRVATQTQLMINLAAHMDDAPLTQNMAKLMNMLQIQVRVMETDNLPDDIDPAADSVRIMLQDRIQLATQGVEEPNLLRTRNWDQLEPVLAAVFRQRETAAWTATLEAAGIPCGPINTVDKALADPQILNRNMVPEIDCGKGQKMKVIGNPIKMSESAGITKIFRETRAPEWKQWVEKGYIKLDAPPAPVSAGGGVTDARESAPPEAYSIPVVLDKPYHTPHIENFLDAIRGKGKLNCPADEAFHSEAVVFKVNEAVVAKQMLLYKPEGLFKQ